MSNICLDCNNKRNKNYYITHKDFVNTRCLNRYYRLKTNVFNHYGNKCSCCGQQNINYLTLEHKNNDGASHKREVGSGAQLYLDIINRNYPPEYTIYCYNCNCSKGHYGICGCHILNVAYKNAYFEKASRRFEYKVRLDVLNAYGNCCAICGNTRLAFLTLDHINNDGAKHRKALGSSKVYYDIRKRNYPKEYRLLCYNCNCSLYYACYCPKGVLSTPVYSLTEYASLGETL